MTHTECMVEMLDVATTKPAVFFQGEDAQIERNLVRVRRGRQLTPDDFFTSALNQRGVDLRQLYQLNAVQTEEARMVANLAVGGIQVGGLSELVRIVNNLIHGGIHNGITLGSLRLVMGSVRRVDTVGVVYATGGPLPSGRQYGPRPSADRRR